MRKKKGGAEEPEVAGPVVRKGLDDAAAAMLAIARDLRPLSKGRSEVELLVEEITDVMTRAKTQSDRLSIKEPGA